MRPLPLTVLWILLLIQNGACFVRLNIGVIRQRPYKLIRHLSTDSDPVRNNETERPDMAAVWAQQKRLLEDMKTAATKTQSAEQRTAFAQRRMALVADTAYFGFFIFCALWTFSSNPFVALSYVFGASMGLAYAYGLGKYVENLGKHPDDEALQGAGVGEARFAFLILLFVIVGKFRGAGLTEVPAIAGFFTYQLASFNQGFREIND